MALGHPSRLTLLTPAVLLTLAPGAWAGDGGTSFDAQVTRQRLTRQRAWLVETAALLGERATPQGCDTQKVFRAVYAPSFAPWVAITLRLDPSPDSGAATGTIELVVQRSRPQADGGMASERYSTPVSAGLFDAVARLNAAEPHTLEDLPSTVLDGMGVLGCACGPGEAPATFAAWSPPTSSRHRWYFRAMADLARVAFHDEPPLFAAETVVTYLSEPHELVYADSGGEPRVLRLTSISALEAERFRALVASVGRSTSLIVDLRNFSGAGTMFRPEFQALDRRKGRTLWVINELEGIDFLANSLGVSRAHMVNTLDTARQRLK